MRASFVLAAIGFLGLATSACAIDSEEEGGKPKNRALSAPGPVAAGDAPVDEPRFASANGSAVPKPPTESPYSCRDGAFCDAFETGAFAKEWSSPFSTGDGELSLGTASASLGHGSLHLSTRDKDSSAYLLREQGPVAASWSGAVLFSFRVEELPFDVVGGPELTVKTPDGPITVRIVVTPDDILLEQRGTAKCLKDRCTATRTVLSPAHASHWYAIRIGFEVNANQTAPYGLIETSVNGGELTTHDLNVPMYDGSLFFSAGITEGDLGRYVNADLDDVSVFVR